ncbi:MAG: Uma2 family endonuclease [Gemmatimonadales bacterium]
MPAERTYVPSMPPASLMTAEQLLHVNIPGKQVELVRGVLVVREPPGIQHGTIMLRLGAMLLRHTDAHDLGLVVVGDPGFKLAANPDTVRGPDIAFIRRERVPHPVPVGFAAFPPDLVIEIRSPSDRPGDMLGKVADWLAAGTRLVWVIDPAHRVAHVYRQDETESTITAEQSLEGENILPGFACTLEAIL